MKIEDIHNKTLELSDRIDILYNWRATENFLQYIQDTKKVADEIIPFLKEGLEGSQEDQRKAMEILMRIRVSSDVSSDIIDGLITILESGVLTNISLAVRSLIEISKKTKISPPQHIRIMSAMTEFFTALTNGLHSSENLTDTRKTLLLSSEPIILLLFLTQVSREVFIQNVVPLASALSSFALFFIQRTDAIHMYLINENIKLQCITTLTQIISLFMSMLKENISEIAAISSFIPELSIFLLSYCPDDAISIKKDIYHHLSVLKIEKKRIFASYSEIILKDGILLRPKNPVLKLLGLTLSTEFLIMFRDTTHRHLSLKVCREAAKILCESNDHTLNKLCANVLVQINDTIISDNISLGEKGFFIRMNYSTFVAAFRKYSQIEVTDETKNVLRSVIRGMKNTMHYFSLFQNISSNAIVFSLKCFSPYEVQDLSNNLGLAFRPFNHFDLEKRTDIIIVCEFLLIFFYLDAALFEKVLMDNVGILFESTKKNTNMFVIWRQFLAYAGVARKFSAVILQELLNIVHNEKDKEFIVLAFREIFTSFAVHTVEIESVVADHLQEIFSKCLVFEERLLYTLEIVKDLFKAAGKEKLEVLHKEMALTLPKFFSKIEEITRLHPDRIEPVELTLTIPVKISGLLPFLGQMSKSLVRALQMKNKLAGVAMETLEMCVDNLNLEFLVAYLGENINKIFTILVDLVQEEESSVMAIKLLGKLSGKACNSFSAPVSSPALQNSELTVIIPGKTDRLAVPLHEILSEAARVLSGEKPGNREHTLLLVGHYFYTFFRWESLSEDVLQRWCTQIEGIRKADFQELHSKVRSGAFSPADEPSHMEKQSSEIPCSLISALFKCAAGPEGRGGAGLGLGLNSAISSVIEIPHRGTRAAQYSIDAEAAEEQVPAYAVEAKRLLVSVYSFLAIFKALELLCFEDFQKIVQADVFCLIAALTRAFGAPDTEAVAQDVLTTMYNISLKICDDREKTSQMTLFYNILHSFCSACYAYSDEEKMCGIKGIIFMTQSLEIGVGWLLYQEIRIVKALFSSLASARYNTVESVREAIFHITRVTHDPAVEVEPTSSEHFMQLILTFAQELSHPLERVRLVSRECLDYSAELFGSDVSVFLTPIREKILAQVLSKPLRALPGGVQIGNMEVMTYLFGLRPPLMGVDEKVERFIGEAFRIIASPNGTIELKQAAVRLFVAAAVSPEFSSGHSLLKISQVLIKGLFSKEEEICGTCRDGLRQMYILGREPNRELLQSWLVPIVNTIGQKKTMGSVISGLVHLQELDREIFKTGLASSLLELLGPGNEPLPEDTVDMIYEIFAKTPQLPDGEFLTRSILAYMHHFKGMQPKTRKKGIFEYLSLRPLAASFLFRLANDDDTAYYILHRYLLEMRAPELFKIPGSSGQASTGRSAHPMAVSGQSTWRQYVLSDAAGEVFSWDNIERMCDMWREFSGDAEFDKVVRKWCFMSVDGFMRYYTAEELRTAPVRAPQEDAETVLMLFMQIVQSAAILSLESKVQKRILLTVESLLTDKSVVCLDGPPAWRIAVAMVLIGDDPEALEKPVGKKAHGRGSGRARTRTSSPKPLDVEKRSPERQKIVEYLKRVLELEALEPVDAIRITAFLVEYDADSSTDSFLPLITAHPEYAQHAIKGIVSLLKRHGVEPFIESISSALEDETLYRTHLYVLLPAIVKVPELFTGSGIESVVCTMVQRLFASGSTRIALMLLQASIVWYREGSICDEVSLILTKAYVTHYIHSKGKAGGPVVSGISGMLFSESPTPVVQERLCTQAVASLYIEAARHNKALAVSMRPAVAACLAEAGLEALEQIVPVAAKVDKECVESIFHSIISTGVSPKLAITCAGLLSGEEYAEKALRILEEGLKSGVKALSGALSSGLKLALKYPTTEILTLVAQILSKYPEVFRHPEIPEVVVSIAQSTGVSSPLKQAVLLAMESEEFQEIRLGLVHTAYVDPQMHREEIAAGLQPLFVKGLSCPSDRIRSDFFKVFDDGVSSLPGERLLYLCTFEWELFERTAWLPAFSRMVMCLFDVVSLRTEVFWELEEMEALGSQKVPGGACPLQSAGYEKPLSGLFQEFRKYKASKTDMKNSVLGLLHGNSLAAGQVARVLLPGIISHLSERMKGSLHAKMEDMLIRLGKTGGKISESAEALIEGISLLCKSAPGYAPLPRGRAVGKKGKDEKKDSGKCRLLEVSHCTGAWSLASDILHDRPEAAVIFKEIGETDYFLAQLRISALYPETVQALLLQQVGDIRAAQTAYEDVQAKAQSGILLYNEAEYKIWEEQWIECAAYMQQWDLLSEIGAATKNQDLVTKAKWFTSDFSIESERAAFKNLLDGAESPDKAFYELFIIGEKTERSEDALYKIVSSTIEEISKYPKLSPRQMHAVEKFQIVVEMNESWQLTGSDDLKRDLAGILLAWKERVPFEWASISFWSMLVRWRTHVFASLWNGKTKEKPLQYRGYHETAHILNLFSKTLRKHQVLPAALTNLESIYTLPNIEISDAYMKLEEHAKCYLQIKEYSAGLDLLGMTNLNYFTSAQKSGVFLMRGTLLEERGSPEEAAKVYAQAVQVHPTNAEVWYKWGLLSSKISPINAINAFMQAAAIAPGALSRKAIVEIVSLMESEGVNEEMEKVFETSAGEVDAWCFVPFIMQMVSILSRTGSLMAASALSRVARVYPQAVYFPVRNALEEERKRGMKEKGPVSDLWTFLKTGFTLMCINIEGIVESFTMRLRASAEEEFYRLLTALLSEAFQQLFGKEPRENGSLSVAIQKIAEMIGLSSLAQKYKAAFDSDFAPFLEETLSTQSIFELSQQLMVWKKSLERLLAAHPKNISIENISRRLVDFDQRNDDIEMFGQYMDITDRAPQMVKISRFEPEINIKRRGGISLRELAIRGSNGTVYQVLLQMPSGKTARREERFMQALALFNASVSRSVEIRKRNAQVPIKKIVSLNNQTKIFIEPENTVSVNHILNTEVGVDKAFNMIFQCRKDLHGDNERSPLMEADALDPEKRVGMFLKTSEKLGDSLMYRYFMRSFNSQSDFFYFRKAFSVSHSVHCFMAYVFSIGSRMPSRVFVGETTGKVYSTDFYPSFCNRPAFEEVPFRLTPNIQKLIGRAGLEGPFFTTMYHMASAFSTKTYLLRFMDVLAKEEEGAEHGRESMQVVRQKVLELLRLDDPSGGIVKLVGNATAPERLCMMDPQWHPWM
ncbi:transformation/transcription domain-associated protein [Nematocida major]|uniref:transformation/transcription domain-associated protein n=1 Tax=Nematocida major TaxID=1912982 RepID=UPI00200779FE|nr:transformation/transcription domain-associated protein [Nematocida major]KAH9385646.1 transformation/transcription domain-associated protein [Nematocida major]